MTLAPFKGKRGLSANGYTVQDVAPPVNPTDSPNREWSETFIRLNAFDPTISYEQGTAVEYEGRIWYAASNLSPAAWNPANWRRGQQDEHWKLSGSNLTLRASDSILWNPVSSSATFSLPTSPVVGDRCVVFDFRNQAHVYPVTVQTTDAKQIENGQTTYVISRRGARVEFMYTGSRWTAIEMKAPDFRVLRSSGTAAKNEVTWASPASGNIVVTIPDAADDGDTYTIQDLDPDRQYTVSITGTGISWTLRRGERLELTNDNGTWRYTSSRDLINKTWRYVNSNAAVSTGDRVLVDTDAVNPITLSLPANPTADAEIRIVDRAGNAKLKPITAQLAVGQTIGGSSSNLQIARDNADVTLVWDQANTNWIIIEMESSVRAVEEFTATDGQTVFPTQRIETWRDVYINGIRLIEGASKDYTIDSVNEQIELNQGASSGDDVVFEAVVSLGVIDTDLAP